MTTTYSDLLSDPPGAAQTIMCGGSAYAEVARRSLPSTSAVYWQQTFGMHVQSERDAEPAMTRSYPGAQVSELGQGSFGVTKLMRHTATGELVAVKFIERGPKVPLLRPSQAPSSACGAAILGQPCCYA